MTIIALLILLHLSEGLSFVFFISCMIFISVFCYFMRMYLWNKYGEEVIVINKDTLIVYDNYKYFKDNYKSYHYDTIDIQIGRNSKRQKINSLLTNSQSHTKNVYVAFKVNDKIVRIRNKINVQIVLKIAEYLKTMPR